MPQLPLIQGIVSGPGPPEPPEHLPGAQLPTVPMPGAGLDQNQGALVAQGAVQPIVFVREIAGGGGNDAITSGELTEDAYGEYLHEYTRKFLVRTTGAGVGVMSVRLAVDPVTGLYVPRISETYVSNDGNNTDEESFAVRVVPRQDAEDPQQWEVDVEYSSDAPDWTLTADNPLDQPADITWDCEEFEVALQQDALGVAVRNSAGDAFDPPPTVKRSYQTLQIIRNEVAYDQNTKSLYVNTLNADAFFGFVAGQVWCRRIAGSRQFHNGVIFWRVTYSFVVNNQDIDWFTRLPSGWKLRVLDQGYRQLAPNSTWAPCTNRGQPVSQPVPLDGAGHQLAQGGTPVFLTFTPYPSKNFGDLNLQL